MKFRESRDTTTSRMHVHTSSTLVTDQLCYKDFLISVHHRLWRWLLIRSKHLTLELVASLNGKLNIPGREFLQIRRHLSARRKIKDFSFFCLMSLFTWLHPRELKMKIEENIYIINTFSYFPPGPERESLESYCSYAANLFKSILISFF